MKELPNDWNRQSNFFLGFSKLMKIAYLFPIWVTNNLRLTTSVIIVAFPRNKNNTVYSYSKILQAHRKKKPTTRSKKSLKVIEQKHITQSIVPSVVTQITNPPIINLLGENLVKAPKRAPIRNFSRISDRHADEHSQKNSKKKPLAPRYFFSATHFPLARTTVVVVAVFRFLLRKKDIGPTFVR